MDRGYILLVEDEPIVQKYNRDILVRRGYPARQAFTLAEARALIAEEAPRAIILDIQLPDGSGLDFLKELRKTSTVPVLMLTAMGTPQDIIRGLQAGGDDYLSKPYDISVFFMRVEALIRRASIIPETIVLDAIRLEPAYGKAFINDKDLILSQKEYALLQLFVQFPEKTMSTEHIFEKVWGQKLLDDDSTLKNTVYRLRKKLEGSGFTIAAERGEGYIFERE